MVTVKQIPLDRVNNQYLPILLDGNDIPFINGLVTEFREELEKNNRLPNKESILERFDNYKLGLCFYETMDKDVFPIVQIDPDKLSIITKYRLKLWQLINSKYGGIILEDSILTQVWDEFREILPSKYQSWDHYAIKQLIFADYTDRTERVKTTTSPSSPADIISLVNRRIIGTILRNSQKVQICIPKSHTLQSKPVKNLFYLSKRFGIYSTIRKLDDGSLQIEIIGPKELVGRKDKYGKAIQLLVENLARHSLIIEDWDLYVWVPWSKRERIVKLKAASIFKGKLPQACQDPNSHINSFEFDSQTEKAFFNLLKQLSPSWKIIREPVFIQDNEVFLPDFALESPYLPTIYIEIIGFWTNEYKTKKIQKMTRFANMGSTPDLILIIDDKLDFPEIESLPQFEYQTNRLKDLLVPLNNYLNKNYIHPYDTKRLHCLMEQNCNWIIELLPNNDKGVVLEQELLKKLKLIKNLSLHQLFRSNQIKELLSSKNWCYIPKVGLITKQNLGSWRKKVIKLFKTTKRHVDLPTVSQAFPEYIPRKAIPSILPYIGFKAVFRGLNLFVIRNSLKKKKR